MNNTFAGKVVKILPRFVSADNSFAKDTFIIESEEQYPETAVMEVFSTAEKPLWKNFNLSVGDKIVAHYHFKANEYNGKYFNSMRVWRISDPNEIAQAQAASQQESQKQPAVNPFEENGSAPEQNDLPF